MNRSSEHEQPGSGIEGSTYLGLGDGLIGPMSPMLTSVTGTGLGSRAGGSSGLGSGLGLGLRFLRLRGRGLGSGMTMMFAGVGRNSPTGGRHGPTGGGGGGGGRGGGGGGGEGGGGGGGGGRGGGGDGTGGMGAWVCCTCSTATGTPRRSDKGPLRISPEFASILFMISAVASGSPGTSTVTPVLIEFEPGPSCSSMREPPTVLLLLLLVMLTVLPLPLRKKAASLLRIRSMSPSETPPPGSSPSIGRSILMVVVMWLYVWVDWPDSSRRPFGAAGLQSTPPTLMADAGKLSALL